jgi:glycosyltransferase involved in cell wall biosynthesis
MTAPRVSIILPTYNGARYLAEALESCLAQTDTDFEVVVVDDASADATPEIVRDYMARDARVRCVRHDTNKRLPAALNTGFANARGELLTWTSDDNRYYPGALAALVQALADHPTASFVYSDFDYIDDAGHITGEQIALPPQHIISGFHTLPCFLYTRQVRDTVGDYAAGLFLAEDYDFWLRVYAARFTMLPVHQKLYAYRRHAQSLTDVHRGKSFAAAEAALVRQLPHMDWLSRRERGAGYLHLASLATWRGDVKGMMRYTARAARYAPGAAARKLAEFGVKRARRAVGR